MIFISRRLCDPSQIRLVELIPGRALHVRVATNPALDLLGVYQHAWNLQKTGGSRAFI